MSVVYQILKEVHNHPFFNFILAVSVVGFMTFSLNYFAVAEDTKRSIEGNAGLLSAIKMDLERNALDAKIQGLEVKIQSIESEIFQLEGIVDSGTATQRDENRLSSLKSELGKVSRELRRVDTIRSRLMKDVS